MMRVGFVGTGNFARQHAEILRGLDVDVVACYGSNQEKTMAFANNYACKIYHDPIQLISPNIIDILYIVIPPFAHDGSVEQRAIEQGIPFFCEKPVGLDLELCNLIANQIESSSLITSSGYLLRYEPLFEEIKKIINRNEISTIRICSYSYMPEVHWWRKNHLSGGMMVESGSHYIDLLRYLFGEITTSLAVTSAGIANENLPACDTYDSMEGILKFESGMIGSIGVTHLLNNIHARNDMLEIYGKDFALKVDLYKLRYKNEAVAKYKELGDADWQTIVRPTSKKQLLSAETLAFVNAVQHNNPLFIKTTYPDAIKTLKVSLAMSNVVISL